MNKLGNTLFMNSNVTCNIAPASYPWNEITGVDPELSKRYFNISKG